MKQGKALKQAALDWIDDYGHTLRHVLVLAYAAGYYDAEQDALEEANDARLHDGEVHPEWQACKQ